MKKVFVATVVVLSSAWLLSCSAREEQSPRVAEADCWKDGVFVQPNVDASKSDAKFIRARVDGKWQDFTIRELPEGFLEWKRTARRKSQEAMRKGQGMTIAGSAHHFGAVASYGGSRADTEFSVNNAFKGIGLLPKREKIKECIKRLEQTWDAPRDEKMTVLQELAEDADAIDRTKLSSLELYTTKDFQTHTFLNIVANPAVSIVFLDIPSYEVRAVCRLVHSDDRTASEEEKDILKYVNLLHDYFHGGTSRGSTVMIFHVIQVFDNSPRAKGTRVTP